ncbi:MAG: ROK family protein [Myxococcales bacterium]|nr:ROK family protein [Myxococcales bacterium]
MRTVLAFDIGGTTAAAALVDVDSGQLLAEPSQAPLRADGSFDEIGQDLAALAAAAEAAAPGAPVQGIAVAAPAPAHYPSGTAWMTHKLRALYGRSWFELVGRPDVPIVALNDADAFCLGELHAGAGRGARRLLALTLGTGLGSAYAVDGEIVREGAGVVPGGELWRAPFAGSAHSIEDEVGRDALMRRYARTCGGGGEEPLVSVAEIAKRARDGEHEACALFEHLGRALAVGVGRSLREFGADRVVLGGGIARSAPLFVPSLESQLAELFERGEAPTIVTAELGARAALLGAAMALVKRRERFARRRVIYLHGFASSPGSFKAQRFRQALEARGVDVVIPDLNEGDFRGLTMSRQLRLLERLAGDAPPGSLLLIGSSLGGYAASLFAAQSEQVAACVLMCPAFDFLRRWSQRIGADELARWRERGELTLHHFGSGTEEQIGYGLIEDAEQHAAFPDVRVPTLIFHGRNDADVDPELSEQFAAERPNVKLTMLDSDHGLGDVIDDIIAGSLPLLARLWA